MTTKQELEFEPRPVGLPTPCYRSPCHRKRKNQLPYPQTQRKHLGLLSGSVLPAMEGAAKTTEGRCRMSVLKRMVCSSGAPLWIPWDSVSPGTHPSCHLPQAQHSPCLLSLSGAPHRRACCASAVTAQGPARLILKLSCLCRSQPP